MPLLQVQSSQALQPRYFSNKNGFLLPLLRPKRSVAAEAARQRSTLLLYMIGLFRISLATGFSGDRRTLGTISGHILIEIFFAKALANSDQFF